MFGKSGIHQNQACEMYSRRAALRVISQITIYLYFYVIDRQVTCSDGCQQITVKTATKCCKKQLAAHRTGVIAVFCSGAVNQYFMPPDFAASRGLVYLLKIHSY